MSKTTAACNSHPTALKRAQKELRNETEKTQNFRCFDQDFSTILPINLQKFACGKKNRVGFNGSGYTSPD